MPQGKPTIGAASQRAHSALGPPGPESAKSKHLSPHDLDLFSDAGEIQRTIAETSPDFILIITLDGTIRYINRVLDANHIEEVIGTSIFDYVTDDERARMNKCFDNVIRTGAMDRYESTYQSPAYGPMIFDCRVAPIFRDRAIVALIINASDMTHQKRTEARLRDAMQNHAALIEASPVGIISIARDGTILSANPAFHSMLGAEIPSIHGRLSLDLVHPDDVAVSRAHLVDLINGERDTCKSELRFRHRNGSYVWVRFSASAISDEKGAFLRLVCVTEDISERKRAERHQRMLMSELDHRVKNNLAALVSLAEQSVETSASLEEFEAKFIGRVTAMARTHEALATSKWEDLDLMQAVQRTFAAHLQDAPPRIQFSGPPVKLRARTVMPLCLALHELATNAVRHGALSQRAGIIVMSWTVDNDMLHLTWRETGGPTVAPPRKHGLGTQLIDGFIRFELHGSLDLRFEPTGVQCDITLPIIDEASTPEFPSK